jgi:cyclomaltodextrinase
MLAEWDTPEIHLAFDMTYDWNLHDIMNGIAKKEKTVLDLIQQIENNENDFPENAFRMQFTSNHDKNSWNGTEFERLGDGVKAFAVLTCVIPDMPLVYTGQEAGNTKRLAFFEKDTVDWKEFELFDIYSKLFQLKKNNRALFNGDRGGKVVFLECTNKEKIFAFTRSSDGNKFLAIFNLSNRPLEFELTGESLQGSYKNYFSGKLESFVSQETFNLNPWEYRIFTKCFAEN